MRIPSFKLAFLFFCSIVYVKSNEHEICKLDLIDDLNPNSPILLCGSDLVDKIIYPLSVEPKTLIFLKDHEFKLFCPHKLKNDNGKIDGPVALTGDNGLDYHDTNSPVTIKCVGQDKFLVDNIIVTYKSLKCASANGPLIQKDHSLGGCGRGKIGDHFRVGYRVSDNSYLDIITFCHHTSSATTYWARAVLKSIKSFQCNLNRDNVPYKGGTDYAVKKMYNEDDPYSIEKQHETFNRLVGKNSRYAAIDTCLIDYITKVELISHGDLVYKSERLASFFWVNVVPIWEKLRKSTWTFIEGYIRDLAKYKKHDFDIWAGGIGVTSILKDDGVTVPVHLVNEGDKKYIPVPDIIYKCVMDNLLEQGICFLLYNNPDVKNYNTAELKIKCNLNYLCKDKIFSAKDGNINGYAFCCDHNDFYNKYNAELGLEGFTKYSTYQMMELFDPNDLSKILEF